MIQVLPNEGIDYGKVGQDIGANLVSGYQERSDEMAIQKALGGLDKKASPRDVLEALNLVNTYNPNAKIQALKRYSEIHEAEEASRQKERQLNIEESKANAALLNAQGKKPKPTEFQKGLEKKLVEQYVKDTKEISELNDTIQNLDSLAKQSEDFRGVTGYLKAKTPFAGASEYDTLGLTQIDKILKIFNPVGAIPIAKINFVKDNFAPRASDTYAVQMGKINTLKRLATQSRNRAMQRVKLIEESQGKITPEQLRAFDEETTAIADALIDQETDKLGIAPKKAETFENLPDPAKYNGKVVTNPATGEKLKSDGKEWKKI